MQDKNAEATDSEQEDKTVNPFDMVQQIIQEKLMAEVAMKTAELSAIYYEEKIKEIQKKEDRASAILAFWFFIGGIVIGILW